jgi:hypothetical protein
VASTVSTGRIISLGAVRKQKTGRIISLGVEHEQKLDTGEERVGFLDPTVADL